MNRLSDFMLPPANSTFAAETDALFNFINVVSLILLVGITVTMIYFAIKYRRKSEDDTTPLITHNSKLEITWSVIPLILVMIVFGWGYNGYLTKTNAPDNAYEIRAIAKSWLWEFHYQTGHVSVNELHVPANRPVKMIISSDDVLHSFYIPEFRVKMDAVPNRYTSVWFEAIEPGEAIVYCAEYCGSAHSNMMADVVIHSQEDFDTWLETGDAIDEDLSPVELGEQLVQRQGCLACHSTDGTTLQGPTFEGIFGRDRLLTDGSTVTIDENYIRQSIIEPNTQVADGFAPIMPTYAGSLNDRQIDAIIEYLKTLD